MSIEEKMNEIADILEVDRNEISEEMDLNEFDTWDSVAVLSVIALMNNKFDKYPHASEFKDLKTISDLINFMN